MYTALDQVVLVVKDLDAAVRTYRDALGFEFRETREIPYLGIRVAFFRVGDGALEIVQPTREDVWQARHLAEKGEGLALMSFRVDDLEATLAELRAREVPISATDFNPRGGRPRVEVDPAATAGARLRFVQGMPG